MWNPPKKLLHAIFLTAWLSGNCSECHHFKIALTKCWQRTQSTFFLVSNHVNSSHLHINAQCFDNTAILKITTVYHCQSEWRSRALLYTFTSYLINIYIGFRHKKWEKRCVYTLWICVFSLSKPWHNNNDNTVMYMNLHNSDAAKWEDNFCWP